jgi:hypothetical protein
MSKSHKHATTKWKIKGLWLFPNFQNNHTKATSGAKSSDASLGKQSGSSTTTCIVHFAYEAKFKSQTAKTFCWKNQKLCKMIERLPIMWSM